ncbi:hypothetical protein [Kurthia zopfii]|nr:Methionine import ATP-binding protein MetN [Kurthia zopfii]
MIQLNDVTKQYKTSNGPLTAVDQVNLEIQDGEIFGIMALCQMLG